MNSIFSLVQNNKIFQINIFTVRMLYSLSEKSVLGVILLALVNMIFLYPTLGIQIIFWSMLLISISVYRLYVAYFFKVKFDKFSLNTWYKIFAFNALITSFIISMLSFIFFDQLSTYEHIFVVGIILIISGGSITSLASDRFLATAYITILMLPLSISLILQETSQDIFLAYSLLLYFVMQIIIILHMHQQTSQMNILRKERIFLNHLFKDAPMGTFLYNTNLTIIDCNQKLCELFQIDMDKILGRNLNSLPDKRLSSIFNDSLQGKQKIYIGPYFVKDEKYTYQIELKTFPFIDHEGEVLGGIGILENKTKEVEALNKLSYQAEHDTLTSLLNRRGFKSHLQDFIDKDKNQNISLLFYVDLNHFKGINDSLGHEIGDQLLLAVSKRFKKVLPKKAVMGRLSGDEFVIFIPNISHKEEIVKFKSKIDANKIKNIFDEPFILQNMHLRIKSSIGIVIIESNFKDIDEILRHADLTMYHAKKLNKTIAYYDASLYEKQENLFLLQNDLGYVLQDNQLSLYFQPVVNIKDDSLYAAELLIRWNHHNRGIILPNMFIPLAKKAGILSDITWWIIDNACKQIRQWKEDNQWKLQYISINVNVEQLIEDNFVNDFFKIIEKNGISYKDIMLEITEQTLIDNFIHVQSVISLLQKKGVKCAIDDFGVGYSSLSYLKKLSFHTLKIDKEFVKKIDKNEDVFALMSNILNIGRQFNYNIVIEGIETQQEKEMLLDLDKKLIYQGFLFSKPIPAEKFTEIFLIG